jgi:hypothetical protein
MSNMDYKNTICIEKYFHEKPIDTIHLGISFIKNGISLVLVKELEKSKVEDPAKKVLGYTKHLGVNIPFHPFSPMLQWA